MILYHGSNTVVETPVILTNGHNKDFGFGFYCTGLEKQAKRWALTRQKKHIVNVYDYEETQVLNVLQFPQMSNEWLEFVIACRRGVSHDYDIVEGPMADDQIWNYVEDYIAGKISKTAFWELVKFKYPTHQIVFCTPMALAALKYERSYQL